VAEHASNIALVRKVSGELRLPIAILYDLPGPKLRLGELKGESRFLKTGQKVVLACGKNAEDADGIPVKDEFISRSVSRGSKIFINDGVVELNVDRVVRHRMECTIVAGGEIRSRKGINLPRADLPVASLTSRDKELLNFAMRAGVDYIGLSFVRSAKNVADLRKLLRRHQGIGIVSKIEKPEAIDDIDNIIDASDAIMVARGDLGIEMPFDEVPLIQRTLLQKCLSAVKPSITATQMMESMIHSARPTRAEAADVAMAVWEGTDAVMLSGETSIGENPALAVKAMANVALEAEKAMPEFSLPSKKISRSEQQAQVISLAASLIADDLAARAIVSPTRSGRTPLFISSTRPATPIIGLTERGEIARRMQLYWGVRSMKMPKFKTVDQMLSHAGRVALESSLIHKGDTIVMISGAHGARDDITKLVEVRRV
jgi:pyruvate kinase